MPRNFNEIEPWNQRLNEFDKFIHLNRSRIIYFDLLKEEHKNFLLYTVKYRINNSDTKIIINNSDFYQKELQHFVYDFGKKVNIVNYEELFIEELISKRKECIDKITKRREMWLERLKLTDTWGSLTNLEGNNIITFIGWTINEEEYSIPIDQYMIIIDNMILVFHISTGYLSEYYGFDEPNPSPYIRSTIYNFDDKKLVVKLRVNWGKPTREYEICLNNYEQLESFRNHFAKINVKDSSMNTWNINIDGNRLKLSKEKVPFEVENQSRIPLNSYQVNLDREIKNSIRSSRQERLRRLGMAKKIPKTVRTFSNQFQRNPDVIVEVLLRSNGICEKCGTPAPFKRATDGSPYLEVHHKIFLSEGGEDTVDNAIALCPNCHREAHFG